MSQISQDPDADLAAGTRCIRCSQDNRVSRRYCSRCGEHLVQACPHCRIECSIDENYCGKCGGDIGGWLVQQQRAIEQACQLALVHRDSNDLTKAIEVLGHVSRVQHPALHAFTENAALLSEQIRDLREQRREEVASLQQQATENESAKQFEVAYELLQRIPVSMRSASVTQQLDTLKTRLDGHHHAREHIRLAIANKQTHDLLPKVLTLLREQPFDKALSKLAKQLLDQTIALGKKRIATHRLDDAFTLFCMIPHKLRSEDVRKQVEKLQEVAYLTDLLESYPIVDLTLEKIASRLQKVAERNPTIAKQTELVRQRLKQTIGTTAVRPEWAKSPPITPFGMPIELGNDAFGVDDSVALQNPAYRECPGRFHVAIGLALQCLDRVPVKTNLLRQKKGGIKEKMERILRTKKAQVEVAWGIDYDDRELRVVAVKIDDESNSVNISHCEVVTIDARPVVKSVEQSSPTENAALNSAVARICHELALAGQHVCIAIPGVNVLFRLMEIPKANRNKLESAIRFEAKHHVPFDLDETIWDYHILQDIRENDDTQLTVSVALLAVKEHYVTERLMPFRQAGVEVKLAQSSVAALYNLAFQRSAQILNKRTNDSNISAQSIDSGIDGVRDDDTVFALIDVGLDSSSFIVVGPELFWSRSWYRGVTSSEAAICKGLRLDSQSAFETIRRPEKLPRLSDLAVALTPFYESMNREVIMSLNTFRTSHPDVPIERIIGTGSGIQVHGLIPFLRRGVVPFLEKTNSAS